MRDLPAHPLFQQLINSEMGVLQHEPMTSDISLGRIDEEAVPSRVVLWHPDAPWVPQPCTRYATRDFRKGYPMTWDLEVPMRTVSRPLFLRPDERWRWVTCNEWGNGRWRGWCGWQVFRRSSQGNG